MKGTAAHAVKCLICGRESIDGLQIRGQTICRQCEARLVRARVGTEAYDTYVKRLKRLWPQSPQQD